MKGVIIAAGYGTRFLPITKCVPKEMLPLVDRPAIDFIMQELVDAGVDEILVVSSRRKKVMEDWFDTDAELAAVFEREGATAKAAKLAPRKARVHFTRQAEMLGTGHAILQARSFVGNEPFVVAFPDDIFVDGNVTAQLIETHQATGGSVLAARDLSGQDVSRYGVMEVTDGEHLQLKRVVEKPAVGDEPSHLVSLGRFLYLPEIFERLEAGMAEHGAGEFFPMDAIEGMAAEGSVFARVIDAERWDTGAPLGYVQAFVESALRDERIGDDVRAWLTARLG